MPGGEMVSSSVRTIRQYCSVCKATLDMAVVDTVQAHEVTWLKCPRCNGILPHMGGADDEVKEVPATAGASADPAPAAVTESRTGLDAAQRAQARDYDPAASYEVGEVVYHRSINSYGRVLEKRVLPGQRGAIRVQFDDGEEMTLRERTG